MAANRFGSAGDRETSWTGETELDLADDESLPWLDSGDEDEGGDGFDASRLMLLSLLALVALAAVIGGIWFVANQTSDEPTPDGSLIAAPDEPYKTRPEDPGGKTFAGTGDTSFAVGEGQTREGQLADRAPVPTREPNAPSIASTMNEGEREPQARGIAVQVGAYPRRADAEAAWQSLTRQTEALNSVRHRVVEAQVDIGTVYRLQAMTGDRSSANDLCAALKNDGLACFVK